MKGKKKNRRQTRLAATLPDYQHVRSPRQWRRCLQRLRQERHVAVDLEANSMYAYQEQVCLIQVSVPGQDYIIDPLADFDLQPFGALLQDEKVEKVFHAAEYDLILMTREFGWTLRNLFDTMWAARILGYDRVGLANMLEELFDIRLDKRYQRANWCRRPLPQAQLVYAQADTHYLLRLRDALAASLEAAGRMEEAQETFAEQCQVTLPDVAFDPESFWSITGANRLPPEGQAILRELNIYRDREARKRDQPHFKILHDRTLMALARKKPRDKQELSQIRGMSRGQMRRYGNDLLQIIAENRGAAAPQRPRRSPRPPEEVLDRYERLRTWRKKRGQARGVESDVIVSREALWEIAWANPQTGSDLQEVGHLGPWRRKTYGDEILRLLNNGTGG